METFPIYSKWAKPAVKLEAAKMNESYANNNAPFMKL